MEADDYLSMQTLSLLTFVSGLFVGSICSEATQPTKLNVPVPELQGNQWMNSEPLSMAGRLGKVTIVHFWTFDCINCRHNLPSYERWEAKLQGKDVAIIGIHTPELPQERVTANVEKKVAEYHIKWPVLLDTDMKNWRKWKQEFWPCVYLVDKMGKIRYRWDGELNYGGMDGERKMLQLVENLLAEN